MENKLNQQTTYNDILSFLYWIKEVASTRLHRIQEELLAISATAGHFLVQRTVLGWLAGARQGQQAPLLPASIPTTRQKTHPKPRRMNDYLSPHAVLTITRYKNASKKR
eukprot:5576724-Amphidinium_carterae.1